MSLAAWAGILLCCLQPGSGELPEPPELALRGGRIAGESVWLRVETADPAVPVRIWDGETELEAAEAPPPEPPTLVLVVDAAVSASRLLRATEEAVRGLMAGAPDLRVGLVFFASRAVVGAAPTTDAEAIARAFARQRESLVPSRESISSGLGVALGLAAGQRRASLLVLTDGEDSLGPIDPNLLWAAAGRAGVPVYSMAIGNRAGESYLGDIASWTNGVSFSMRTPAGLTAVLEALVTRLRSERVIAARLVDADAVRERAFRAGLGAEATSAAVSLYGPLPREAAHLLAEVRGPGGAEERTLVVAKREGSVVALGLTGTPLDLPPGLVDLEIGTAPTTRLTGLLLEPNQERSLEAIELAAVAVTGPDLGRPDGTGATLLTPDGEKVIEIACGETALVRPGAYALTVDTRPRWEPSDVWSVAAGATVRVDSPGMGSLRIDLLGEGGAPLECLVPVRDARRRLAATVPTGREVPLLAGRYELQIPIPRTEPTVWCEVAAGAARAVRLADYGALLLHAVGPGDRPLALRLLVRDAGDDGKLLAAGEAGTALPLRAGTYDVELLSTPAYRLPGVTIRAGARTEETVARFGALYVTGEAPGLRVRVRQGEERRWVGVFAAGEEILLPDGEYWVGPEPEQGDEQRVTVEPQRVTRAHLEAP